jgi:hypothetical protein
MAVINYVTLKAIVFVKASNEHLTMAKALGYWTTELIMSVKSFKLQSPECFNWVQMATSLQPT